MAWDLRNHPNFYLCCYEKLKKNSMEEYKKLTTFLGKDVSSEDMEKVTQLKQT